MASRERLRITPRSAVRAVAMLGATLVLIRVADAAQRVLGWILVAAVLACLLHPLVLALQRRMPRGLAVAVVMGTLVATLAAIGYGLVDNISRETDRLQTAGPERAREIERSPRFGKTARDLHLAERTERFLDGLPERLRGGTPAEAIQAAATRGVAYLTTGVLTIFFLLHGPRLAAAAARQIREERRRRRAEAVAYRVYQRAFGYTRSNLAMALAAGLFAYVAARMASVPGPAPLGFWVGLWDLVPVAGAFLGALPIVVLAAVASGGKAAVLAVAFVAYQVVENVVVQRRVESRTVKVGPFLTLAAGLVGLELSGVAGALLSVLVVTVAITVADELAGDEDDPDRGPGETLEEPATESATQTGPASQEPA